MPSVIKRTGKPKNGDHQRARQSAYRILAQKHAQEFEVILHEEKHLAHLPHIHSPAEHAHGSA